MLYIYTLFFGFLSHLGHCRALSRGPHATQQVLISYLFYMQYQQRIYVNPKVLFSSMFKTFYQILMKTFLVNEYSSQSSGTEIERKEIILLPFSQALHWGFLSYLVLSKAANWPCPWNWVTAKVMVGCFLKILLVYSCFTMLC